MTTQSRLQQKLKAARDHTDKAKPDHRGKATIRGCSRCGRLWCESDDDFEPICPTCGIETKINWTPAQHIRKMFQR